MATTFKKSVTTIPHLLFLTLTLWLGVSCNDHKEDGVWIPVPKDTSSLGRLNHLIPVRTLDQYRKDYIAIRDSLTGSKPDLYFAESEAFNKPQLLELLKNDKCVGIRIIYGLKKDTKSEFRCMIVGVDEQGRDLYIQQGSPAAAQTGPGDFGLEYGQCAPPCDGGR